MLILRIIQLFITWLLIACLVGLATRKLKLPYTVGLVVVGLILAVVTPLIRTRTGLISPQEIRTILIPNFILAALVPPLIFETAIHIRWEHMRPHVRGALALAVPGVFLSMLVVGAVLHWGADISLPVALAFGALIASTDPVAVVALFKTLGAPRQLMMLLEGESLVNDGPAIVLFHVMLGVVTAGQFRLLATLADFLIVFMGGLLVGGILGILGVLLLRWMNDHLSAIALSLALAFGSYLLADHLHVSGVIAVMAAGLMVGNFKTKALNEYAGSRLIDSWELFAFLANSFVFLIIGLTVEFNQIVDNIGYILLAIAAVLLSRAIVVYGFSRLLKGIPMNYQHVLFWGALRGAVSLALALSLTAEELGADLERLQAMAFGVVLFTLLVQGTSMTALARRLRIREAEPQP